MIDPGTALPTPAVGVLLLPKESHQPVAILESKDERLLEVAAKSVGEMWDVTPPAALDGKGHKGMRYHPASIVSGGG